MSSGSDQKVKI